MLVKVRKSARMGNRKPATTGTGMKPQERISHLEQQRGYRINPATGMRVYL